MYISSLIDTNKGSRDSSLYKYAFFLELINYLGKLEQGERFEIPPFSHSFSFYKSCISGILQSPIHTCSLIRRSN